MIIKINPVPRTKIDNNPNSGTTTKPNSVVESVPRIFSNLITVGPVLSSLNIYSSNSPPTSAFPEVL